MRLVHVAAGVAIALVATLTSGSPVGPKPLAACQVAASGRTCDEQYAFRQQHIGAMIERLARLHNIQVQHPNANLGDVIARTVQDIADAQQAAEEEFCGLCPDRCS